MNLEYFNLVYFLIVAISFWLSLGVCFQKNAPSYLRLFTPFLLLTLLIEYIGRHLRLNGIPNTPMYNFFAALEFVFYFFVMLQLIKNEEARKIIIYTIYIYPFIALINIFFIQGFKLVNTYTENLGALLLIVFCAYYFYELIKQPVLPKPARKPGFWISCGLIFFYSVTLPLRAAINLSFEYSFVDVDYIVLLQITPNYILYSSFAVAFVCYFKYDNQTLLAATQPLPTKTLVE